MRDPLQLYPKLEAMGEPEVRVQLARGMFSADSRPLVQEWLDTKDKERNAAAAAKQEAREEETLSIARKALVNSHRANVIAVAAMTLAALATIVAAIIGVMFAK